MLNNSELLKIFSKTKLILSEHEYSVVSISVKYWDYVIKNIEPAEFVSITKDREDEISIILPSDSWQKVDKTSLPNFSSKKWRLISFEGEGLIDLVGYLAKLSLLLAQNDITLLAFSTYKKSNFLVKATDYDRALAIFRIFLRQPNI